MSTRFMVLLLVVSQAAYSQSVGKDDGLVIWYDKPASAWEEALPLGNGKTGAMVFGGVEREQFQLNDNTLWSGYPDPGNNPQGSIYLPLVRSAVADGDYALAEKYWKKMQGPYSARYLHMGNLLLDFAHGGQKPRAYKRQLDLNAAVSKVSFGINGITFVRESFISHPDQVMVVRITANKKKSVSWHAWLNSKLRYTSSSPSSDEIVLKGKAPIHVANRPSEPLQVVYANNEEGEGMNFRIHVRIQTEGGTLAHSDSSLRVSSADAVTIYLTGATSFNGFDKSPGLNGKMEKSNASLFIPLGGNCRVASLTTLKVLEASYRSAKGPNKNPLMVVPARVAFKNHSLNKVQPASPKAFAAIDFETEKGKTYTLVPL